MVVKARPMSTFAETIVRNKYAHENAGTKEDWLGIATRVVKCVVGPYLPEFVAPIAQLVIDRKFIPGGRYLYAAGRRYPQVNNCFLFFAEDSRQGWGSLADKTIQSLMTGGGVGIVYSRLREEGAAVLGMGGQSTGPCSVAGGINEFGRRIVQGGSRRSALWGGLHWSHPDVFKWMHLKDWDEHTREGKRKDFMYPAEMDGTNISIILDSAFFAAYHNPSHHMHAHAHRVFWEGMKRMCKTGEPGFSIDCGENEGENLRNACTEVTSADDDDMCNLGSINMGGADTIEEFRTLVELGTIFLLCGTIYSKLPIPSMHAVREKNRRLGLGLMGVHEWLLKRMKRYGPDNELGEWLGIYKQSGSFANRWADRLGISRPVATRAIAPTGTISIAAETTSGGEPIPYVAYKRRYLDGKINKAQYVIDPTAHRLVLEGGCDPEGIEDSCLLAKDVERRIAFQAWMQQFVDHGISSTINLPPWGTEYNNEETVVKLGNTLLKYLPNLRGITVYPDGARSGQPFVKVPYAEAIKQLGVEFVDGSDASCPAGICGL